MLKVSVGVELEHRQIGARIKADHTCLVFPAVGSDDLDRIGGLAVVDHMRIGHDKAVGSEHNAAALRDNVGVIIRIAREAKHRSHRIRRRLERIFGVIGVIRPGILGLFVERQTAEAAVRLIGVVALLMLGRRCCGRYVRSICHQELLHVWQHAHCYQNGTYLQRYPSEQSDKSFSVNSANAAGSGNI